MRYTSSIQYRPAEVHTGKRVPIDHRHRLKIDEEHPSYWDAAEAFNPRLYRYPYLPLFLGPAELDVQVEVLRLLIKEPHHDFLSIPRELEHLTQTLLDWVNYHQQFYPSKNWLYLTCRTTSGRESMTWHVDGFQGGTMARHRPEQNIIWCDRDPTEFLLQPFDISHLDENKHNVHRFFESAAHGSVYQGVPCGVYLTTPYNVHRRPASAIDRKFVRLSFSPVEICDPTNTENPMLPKTYPPRDDVRNHLWDYTHAFEFRGTEAR